jgi:hypothetical protein
MRFKGAIRIKARVIADLGQSNQTPASSTATVGRASSSTRRRLVVAVRGTVPASADRGSGALHPRYSPCRIVFEVFRGQWDPADRTHPKLAHSRIASGRVKSQTHVFKRNFGSGPRRRPESGPSRACVYHGMLGGLASLPCWFASAISPVLYERDLFGTAQS